MGSAEYLRSVINALKGVRYKNLSQLAETAGIPQGNFSLFMKGKRNQISFDTVWRIFLALGLEFPDPSKPPKDSVHTWESERIRQLEAALNKAEGRLEGRLEGVKIGLQMGKAEAQAGLREGKNYGLQELKPDRQDVG